MIVIQDLAKTGHDLKFKMAVMPICVKTIQTTSSPEPLNRFTSADILHEAYGALSYIKLLKLFRLDHKRTLSGWGKFGK